MNPGEPSGRAEEAEGMERVSKVRGGAAVSHSAKVGVPGRDRVLVEGDNVCYQRAKCCHHSCVRVTTEVGAEEGPG